MACINEMGNELTQIDHHVQWFFLRLQWRPYRYQEQRSEDESWLSQRGILQATKRENISAFYRPVCWRANKGAHAPTRTALAPPKPPAMNDFTLSAAVVAAALAALAVWAVTSGVDPSSFIVERHASARSRQRKEDGTNHGRRWVQGGSEFGEVVG